MSLGASPNDPARYSRRTVLTKANLLRRKYGAPQLLRSAKSMRVIAKPVVSGGTNEMVATRPAIEKTESSASPVSQDDGAPGAERVGAPPTDLPMATEPVSSSESLKIEVIGSEKSGGSVPPFVALMYSSSSRPSAPSSDPEASTRSETLARHRTMRSARLTTDREVLHPAWFDALPASLDDLRTEDGALPTRHPWARVFGKPRYRAFPV